MAPCDNCESSLHNHGERRLPYKVEHHIGLLQVLVMSLTEPNSSLQLGKNLEINPPYSWLFELEKHLDKNRSPQGFSRIPILKVSHLRQFQAIREVSLPKISPRSQSKPTRARFFQPAGGESRIIERKGYMIYDIMMIYNDDIMIYDDI